MLSTAPTVSIRAAASASTMPARQLIACKRLSSPTPFLSANTSAPAPSQRHMSTSASWTALLPASRTLAAAPTSSCSQSRSASTTASSSSPASSSSTAASASNAPPSTDELTWNHYLHLRTIRRRYNLAASAVTAAATTTAGAAALAGQEDLERLSQIGFGLDPVVVMGMCTLAAGAAGWLVGPFGGNAVFNLVYRRFAVGMRAKEKDFYARIKRNRSDPAGQSMNNPVPDYYGEKITSVRDYRRWLKDQRAFRKKREG